MMIAAALAGWLAAGCDPGPECTVPEGLKPDWIRVLGCARDYELLWDDRDGAVFAGTRTINWLIDREDENRVYFINSVEWQVHYFFALTYLDKPGFTTVGTHSQFNLLNYRRENRRFVLGKLITYVDQDLVTLEFSAGDTASVDMIVDTYHRVAGAIYNGGELLYRPVSARQEAMLDDIRARIPVIGTDEVYSGQTYQPLHRGTGFGTLRFRRLAELAAQSPAPTDIVVLDQVPNDITMVSGVITAEFQTPLSHINILARNRGTPNMALKGAFDDPELRALDGALVRLEVTSQGFSVTPASPAEAQAYWDSLRPAQTLLPEFDLSATELFDIAALGAADSDKTGAKAANMGEMTRISSVTIPLPDAPFAIPFAHYDRHVQENGIAPLIDGLLADMAAAPLAPDVLRERLFAIRWAIFRAPASPELIAQVGTWARARWSDGTRVRFRSSTNAEDLAEFSGAGLYTSASATLNPDGDAALADAIKVVWASVWNEQAFVEREFYRVDHRRVYMGILVHPAFTGELANGVAITINEFNALRPAYYINSQVGDVSVTNPTGQAIPEQILYYTWFEEPEYEVITRSSLLAEPGSWPAGHAVFTNAELEELAVYLEAIHNHFRGVYQAAGQNFAMDVEIKLAPGRELVIKQARPLKQKTF